MRTNETKQEIIARLKKEIENRKSLRAFYENEWPMLLKKWDGKVFNKRFKDAVEEELRKISPLMYAKFTEQGVGHNSYSNINDKPIVQMIVCFRNSLSNYNDREELYTNIVCRYDDNFNSRISAEDTPTEHFTIVWFENFNEETENEEGIIENYDKYMEVAEQMEQAVKAYNDLPYRFRANMDTTYTRIY